VNLKKLTPKGQGVSRAMREYYVVLRVPGLGALDGGLEITRGMLSDANLEARGQVHESIVMYHCAALAGALKAQIRCSIFLAPIDMFRSAIQHAQQGQGGTEAERIKHDRLVTHSSAGFKSDVIVVIGSANAHYTLTIAIRASRSLYLVPAGLVPRVGAFTARAWRAEY
jgi:hypothetical protein